MASLIWEGGDSIFIENLIKMVSRSMGTRSRNPAGASRRLFYHLGCSRLPTPLTQNLSDSNRLKTSRSYCTQVLCCAANEEWRKSFPLFPLHFLTLETNKKNCVKIHLMLKSSSLLERIAHYYRELDNNNSNNNHISSRAFLFAALSLSTPFRIWPAPSFPGSFRPLSVCLLSRQ